MKRKLDKYDKQIARLKKHPDKIEEEWFDAIGLFRFVVKHPEQPNPLGCGCLIMIKQGYTSEWPELNQLIRADKAIPRSLKGLTPKVLPRFAYWQRKIDKLRKESINA